MEAGTARPSSRQPLVWRNWQRTCLVNRWLGVRVPPPAQISAAGQYGSTCEGTPDVDTRLGFPWPQRARSIVLALVAGCIDCSPETCQHVTVYTSSDSPFLLGCAGILAVVVVVVGAIRYRRGDRWTLVILLTPAAGALLGIYASDHKERWLALPALVLICAGPVARLAIYLIESGRRRGQRRPGAQVPR